MDNKLIAAATLAGADIGYEAGWRHALRLAAPHKTEAEIEEVIWSLKPFSQLELGKREREALARQQTILREATYKKPC